MCRILSCNTVLKSQILLIDQPHLDHLVVSSKHGTEIPQLPTMA
jgi:hypothetical protein